MLIIFSCAYWLLHIFFGGVFIQVICPFKTVLFLLLSHKSSFTFWVLDPFQIYSLQIFSPIV